MKKDEKKGSFPWQKVLVIAVGVLFVFMMVLSAMGTSWLQSFRTVMANDSVTIDFTLRDARGNPVLTTDKNLYQAAIQGQEVSFLTSPLTVRAGYAGNPGYTGLDAVNYYLSTPGEQLRFAILGQELDDIDIAVLGMKTGQQKTIQFAFPVQPVIFMSYEFETMGGNFSTVRIGDPVPIGFSETPMVSGLESYNKTPTNEALRIGTVTNKTTNTLEIGHKYPVADITVRSIR